MALIKFGNLMPDQPGRSMEGCLKARNCLPDLRSYRPVRKLVPDTEPLPAPCKGASPIRNNDGTIFNYAGTDTDIYERTGSSWTSVGSGFNMLEGDYWDFMIFNNQFIAAGGDNIVQSGAPGASVAPITGAPIARRAAIVRNFLVTGDIQTDRRLVKWSGLRDETQWAPGINQSGEQVLNIGGNITKVVPGEYGVILTEDTVYRMQYVGAPIVFQFDDVTQGKGCISPGSVAQVGHLIFYLSVDGFYIFDGTQAFSIGSTTVNRSFFKDFDNSYPRRVTSAIDLENTLVYWAYPSLEAKIGSPDKMMVYNWTTKNFSGPIDIPSQVLVYDQSPGVVSDEIAIGPILMDDSLTGAIISDGSQFKGGEERILTAFNDKNEHCSFTGETLECELQSYEFTPFDRRRAMMKEIRTVVEGEAPIVKVNVASRLKSSGTSTPTGDILADDDQAAHMRVNSTAFKVTVKVSGNYEHVVGFEPFSKQMGYRK